MVRRLADRNKRREQQAQSLLLDKLTARFRGKIRRELKAAMLDMAGHFRLTGEVPLPATLRPRIEALYRSIAETSIPAFARRIEGQGKAAGLIVERKEIGREDFARRMARLAQQYIDSEVIRQRITSVTETTRAQIIAAVSRGYAEGLGQDGVADYIESVVAEISRYRAEVIARTETHGAANFGAMGAAEATGLPLLKEWVAAADERTRETHREADGQTVPMEQAFEVGADFLMFPGDPAGSAEEVINCRCAASYVVDPARAF